MKSKLIYRRLSALSTVICSGELCGATENKILSFLFSSTFEEICMASDLALADVRPGERFGSSQTLNSVPTSTVNGNIPNGASESGGESKWK